MVLRNEEGHLVIKDGDIYRPAWDVPAGSGLNLVSMIQGWYSEVLGVLDALRRKTAAADADPHLNAAGRGKLIQEALDEAFAATSDMKGDVEMARVQAEELKVELDGLAHQDGRDSDELATTREIRSWLAGLSEEKRASAILIALEEKDEELIRAAAGAPACMRKTLIPGQHRERLFEAAAELLEPGLHLRWRALSRAAWIGRATYDSVMAEIVATGGRYQNRVATPLRLTPPEEGIYAGIQLGSGKPLRLLDGVKSQPAVGSRSMEEVLSMLD